MQLVKFKGWIVLFAILTCLDLLILEGLDFVFYWNETSTELIREWWLFNTQITEYEHNRIFNKLNPAGEVLGGILAAIVALSFLNMLRLKFGRNVLDMSSSVSSKVASLSEDKTMDKMLKLKQLYDSELITKDEYDMKLAKLKRSVI